MNATQHGGRTQPRLALDNFLKRKPVASDDALIEFALLVAAQEPPGISDAQKLLPGLRVNPQVHADKFFARNVTSRFFAGFADYGLFGRFVGLDVSAGLTEYVTTGRILFDEQESSFTLYDSRNCQIGYVHRFLYAELAKFHFDFTG